jgi:hypothetical protein
MERKEKEIRWGEGETQRYRDLEGLQKYENRGIG